MRRAAAWLGIIAFFAGVLVLGAWATHDCDRRGGHMVAVVPGKVYKCSK